jgi:tRNA-splicing ligase RtcB
MEMRSGGPLKEMARQQLGTVGSGNHYVDLFTDERDRVLLEFILAPGDSVTKATWFLKKAGAADRMDVEPCVIGARSDLEEAIIRACNWGEYAYAGRDWVCERLRR